MQNRYLLTVLILFITIISSTTAEATIKLYGPGGPHLALQEVAKVYKEKNSVDVIVTFGPQDTWDKKAKVDADILFGPSESSAIAIANRYSKDFSIYEIQPIYLHSAIILVKKGNPKKIQKIEDLAKPGVGIVVNDGLGTSNTSGTGVWEDILGRTQDIKLISAFRKNILNFAPNSGAAMKAFNSNPKIDAWITWSDWPVVNPNAGDMIKIAPNLLITRDLNIVLKKSATQEIKDFANFLTTPDAEKIFKKFGYFK